MAPVDPSDREDEYFKKLDLEKVKKMRTGLDKKREDEARTQRKEIKRVPGGIFLTSLADPGGI